MDENKEITLECGELILEVARSEYDNERSRTTIIDSKSNIVFSFASVIFVAMSQLGNIKMIFSFKISDFGDLIFPLLLFVFLIGAYICLLISIVFLISVISTKEYQHIDVIYFYTPQKMSYSKEEFASGLAYYYIETKQFNKEVNDRRTQKYRLALILIAIALFSFVAYVFIASFV